MISKRRLTLVLLGWIGCCCAREASAAEPVDAFLETLRSRRYYDEAFDYLKQVEGNPHLDETARQRVLYEQALTVYASANDQSELPARQTQLTRAAELFEAFCAKHPAHPLVASAKNQVAGVLVERGRNEILAGETSDKAAAAASARKLFEQARGQFTAAEKGLEARLGKLPKLVTPDDPQTLEQKRQLNADLAQSRLLLAGVDYDLAKTFDAGSAKAKEHLQAAAKSYAKLYDTYRTRSVGLLARLWEGRCHQELGEMSKALGCFRELADLEDSPDTRLVRTKSTRHALECWTNANVKKYAAAIEYGQRWEKHSSADTTDPDALAIRYLTALAYQEQANSLPTKDPNRKKLTGAARDYVSPVARHPGEYQRPAKMLLVALGSPKDGKRDSSGTPDTFAAAFEQARTALEHMQESGVKLAAEKNKQAAEKLKAEKDRQAAQAEEMLQLALRLRDAKTSLEDLNSARYYLCYLNWDQGRYYDAAVLGEFLASHYPDTLAGRQGAKIALAAFVRLYSEAKPDDRSFELAQIEKVANLTFKHWPDQEEAEDAALTLVNFAAADQQFERAVQYLGKIPANSPRRGPAEMRAGQSLWSAYVRAVNLPEAERPAPEKLDALKKQARDLLAQGIGRLEKAPEPDAALVSGAFSLAQICVETGQPDKAITWLENPRFGPLTMVKSGNKAAAREGFDVETYKLALRAYIAVNPQQLKKAEDTMNALEKLVAGTGDAKAAENLTAIYISLGRQLQQHLQELRASNQKAELESVSKAFEVFLDRVMKRGGGTNYATLNWIGETYYSLAKGMDSAVEQASPQVKQYYDHAADAYKKMLEIALADPKYKEQPDALVAIRLRLAECYQRAGKFDDSIDAVYEVLRTRPTVISAQILAAETYQAKGAVDSNAYALAIGGSNPGRDGKNVIWGWNKISMMTRNNDKFEENFYHARLQMAESRFLFAMAEKNPDRKKKVLSAAVADLWNTYRQYPTMGGPETMARFDKLLKSLQKAQGTAEVGLEEFKKREAASADAKE